MKNRQDRQNVHVIEDPAWVVPVIMGASFIVGVACGAIAVVVALWM